MINITADAGERLHARSLRFDASAKRPHGASIAKDGIRGQAHAAEYFLARDGLVRRRTATGLRACHCCGQRRNQSKRTTAVFVRIFLPELTQHHSPSGSRSSRQGNTGMRIAVIQAYLER